MKKILYSNWVINFISIATLFGFYQAISLYVAEPLVFPSLQKIFITATTMLQSREFYITFYYTLSNLLYCGFICSIATIVTVTICWKVEFLRRIFECYSSYFISLPNFTIVPLLIIVFGVTNSVLIFTAVINVFFTQSYQILIALDTLSNNWRKHVKNLDLNLFDSLKLVYIPAAAPIIVNISGISWIYMWRTYISLEVVLGNFSGHMGLGTYLMEVKSVMDIDKMYVVIFFIGLFGYFTNKIFNYAKAKVDYQ